MTYLCLILLLCLPKASFAGKFVHVFAYETFDKKTSVYDEAANPQTVYVQERICIEVEEKNVDRINQTITILEADITDIYGNCTKIAAKLPGWMFSSLEPNLKDKMKTTLTYEGLIKAALIIFDDEGKCYNVQVESVTGQTKWEFFSSNPRHKLILKYSEAVANPANLQITPITENSATIHADDKNVLNSIFADEATVVVYTVAGINAILCTKDNTQIHPGWNLKIYKMKIPELPKTKTRVRKLTKLTPGNNKIIQIAVGGGGVLVDKTSNLPMWPMLKNVFATEDSFFVMIDEWIDRPPIVPASSGLVQ